MKLSAGGIKRDKVQEEAEEILGAMERDKTQLDFVHNQVGSCTVGNILNICRVK